MPDTQYEERLGTDRMLPLVFRMALPAVAAQLVNLLYTLVDRVYIGHIPGIGTDALAGVGVKGLFAFGTQVLEAGSPNCGCYAGSGAFTFYHGQYGEFGGFRAERQFGTLW